MTPAGTSNELDVQNEWEENTHTHCSRVKIWSRETGSAVSPHVSPLSTHGIILAFRDGDILYRQPPSGQSRVNNKRLLADGARHRERSISPSNQGTSRNGCGVLRLPDESINNAPLSFLILPILLVRWALCCLKKNQNPPRPSEHLPVRGKKCQNVQ